MSGPFDVLVGVPIDCSGAFAGCERLPAALRAAGIASALGARDAGNLQVAIADPVRDPETGIVGFADVVALSQVVCDGVGALLDAGERPLVLGGDCTLLIGVVAALRPGTGLLFVDGHLDCYDGATSPTGEAADLELAVLLGVGPPELTAFAALAHDRVVVLGPSDEAEAAEHGAPDPRAFAPEVRIVPWDELRTAPAEHARAALDRLRDGGFWLHLDLDVLSSAELPAVDYAVPEGLTWDELLELLRPVLADEGLGGASVAVLNPTLEGGDTGARRAVRLLADASR